MSNVVLTEAKQVPLKQTILLLESIEARDFSSFQDMERGFVQKYGVDVWQEYFNFNLLPSLDKTSSNWLLSQFLSR